MDDLEPEFSLLPDTAAAPPEPEAQPRPIWCWQGLLSVGLVGAWTLYLQSPVFIPFRFNLEGLLAHCLVIGASLVFGGLEFRKLFQDRDTTPGLILAIVGIGSALLLTYLYVQSWVRLSGSEF